MSNSVLSHQLRLHFIVLIFGFTGVLGKLIELPSEVIVTYRVLIACVALIIYFKSRKINFTQTGKDTWKWLLTGIIVGLHWYFFFESIKQSTVSVALVSFSSTALFTAILEPLFHRRRFHWHEVIFSLLIIVGMTLVLRFEFKYVLGIFFGVLGAFLASLFTVLNSKFITKQNSDVISFYELLGGFIFMLLLVLVIDPGKLSVLPTTSDIIYLLLLGIVATAFAFAVAVQVMKMLTPFTVSLTINLEPLYGILLALLVFGDDELMSGGFYVGFGIILTTILLNAYVKKKARKLRASELLARPK